METEEKKEDRENFNNNRSQYLQGRQGRQVIKYKGKHFPSHEIYVTIKQMLRLTVYSHLRH